MAFPVVESADTQSGSQASDSTSWTLTYPTNLARGDRIVAVFVTDGVPSALLPAGWVGLIGQAASGSAATLHVWVKTALGTETGNFTVTLSAAEQGVWRVLRITGWYGAASGSFQGAQVSTYTLGTGASGASTAPDPGNCAPDRFGAEDTLWIAVCGADDGATTVTGFPTNYTGGVSQESGGAGGAALGIAFRELNAASEDAGAFTIDASEEWAASAIAIRPDSQPANFPRLTGLTETNGTTATANAAVDLPPIIDSGDLLLVLHRSADGTAAHGYPAGDWNVLFDDTADGSDDRISLAWREADGTEGASITITQTSSKFSSIAWVWQNTADPDTQPPEFATLVTGASTTPDPGALSPTGGAKNYAWIWAGGWEGEQTNPPASSPTSYESKLGGQSGTAGLATTNVRVAAAHRWLNAASEDPGSWTISASDQWTATVIAVHPAAGGAFSLDADPGSYALTGSAAGALADRMLTAAPGDYDLTGIAASVPAGRVVSADPGSYTLTGFAASLLADRTLEAAPGVYAVTGADASLVAERILAADPGAYVITGIAAELALQGMFVLSADPGSYAIAGAAAGLVAGRIVVAAPGTYAITGEAASLIADRLLSALPGSYLLTGANATLEAGTVAIIVTGHFDSPTPGGSLYDRATPSASAYDSPTPSADLFDQPTPS